MAATHECMMMVRSIGNVHWTATATGGGHRLELYMEMLIVEKEWEECRMMSMSVAGDVEVHGWW